MPDPAAQFLRRAAVVAASIALAGSAQAEQIHWPWQSQRPTYRSAPSHHSMTTHETTNRKPASDQGASEPEPTVQILSITRPTATTTSPTTNLSPPTPAETTIRSTARPSPTPEPIEAAAPPTRTAVTAGPARLQPAPQFVTSQTAAQTAPNGQERRPQTLTSSAASAQAAASCMNERKSASVETAIASCNAVIDETLKNLANAYYFRASAKFGKSDFDGAITDYGQALRLDPSDADYLNSRASAYEAKNDTDKALADYSAAIKANPKSVYAYNNRGSAYQRKGDYARAAADYGEVTRLQPDNIEAWSARCWVRAISPGQVQSALSDCNQALKIKADAPDVLDTRGFVYLRLGQPDNAIKDYDAALKADPKLAGSLYGRGIARLRKGDRNGGSADITAAKAIRTDIADEFSRYGLKP